jgi:signal transduction histidine kinase
MTAGRRPPYGSRVSNARTTRFPRPRDLPVAVVPVLAALFQLVASSGAQYGSTHWHSAYSVVHLDHLGYSLLIAGPAVLLARRRAPVPTLVAVLVITLAYHLREYPFGPYLLTPFIGFVATVLAGRRRAAWICAAASYVVVLAASFLPSETWLHSHRLTLGLAIETLVWLVLILIGSDLVRIRSERAAESLRSRQEEERRKASEERLRMARELHDVLAHNISMINVQAGVALHLMDERPEQARTALAAIKEASKEALTEMRSVLGVLRQVDEAAPRSPTAGLARLDDLLVGARAGGLTVRVETDGEPEPLHAGVDLAAFRIVQESLTNAARHAGPGVTAIVRLGYRDHDLVIRVEDDGRGVPGDLPTGGSGLAGMRERVGALGGELFAGPRDGGGFMIEARLPLTTDGEA